MSNTEKISAYLDNEMSASERIQFEQQLVDDPALKREFDLQNEVIEGIKEARKQELKAMLNQIPVPGGTFGTITFGKIASGIAIIGALAIGIYYISTKDEDKVIQETVEEPIKVKPEVTEEKVDQDLNTEQIVDNEASEEKSDALIQEENSREPARVKSEPIDKTKSENKQPEIKRPSAAPVFESSDSDSLEAPTDAIVKNASGNITSLDVKVESDHNKYDFHYQFNRGKLHLYGDFDKELYQILEFKTKAEKALFLYYDGKFYPLNKNQVRIVELTPVTDKSLNEKLNAIITQE